MRTSDMLQFVGCSIFFPAVPLVWTLEDKMVYGKRRLETRGNHVYLTALNVSCAFWPVVDGEAMRDTLRE